MDIITLDELKVIADERNFNIVLLEKDYLLTLLLYYIKDIEGLHFKGGTALNKIYLDHQRLSEDLDFSLTIGIKNAEKQIRDKLKGTFFKKITHDNRYDKFVRLIVHYNLFHDNGTIYIDLNEKQNTIIKPNTVNMFHFYKNNLPEFKVDCLEISEMTAEKIRATCQRYKPRDYYDLYYIIKKRIPIDLKLVSEKFNEYDTDFDASLIFKNTNKIFRDWNDDLFNLTKSKLEFEEMINTLKKYFEYKD